MAGDEPARQREGGKCRGPEVGAGVEPRKVRTLGSQMRQRMEACVRPRAFTLSEHKPLQGPERDSHGLTASTSLKLRLSGLSSSL